MQNIPVTVLQLYFIWYMFKLALNVANEDWKHVWDTTFIKFLLFVISIASADGWSSVPKCEYRENMQLVRTIKIMLSCKFVNQGNI